MDKQCCFEKCVMGCIIFLIVAVVMGPVILGVFGIPGLIRVVAEDKHSRHGLCKLEAQGYNLPFEWCFFGLCKVNCDKNATHFMVHFFLKQGISTWENVSFVNKFEQAYAMEKRRPTVLNVSRDEFFNVLLPSLNGFTPTFNKSKSCVTEHFPCNYLNNKPYVVYVEAGSQVGPLLLFSVGLALTVLGGFPILIVCIMISGDHLSVKHMMYKSRKREKKVKDTMDILGSGDRTEQWKALRNLDLATEYFHGRYHRATLFDIAAHSGNVQALEFLYTQPQVTIDGVLPSPDPKNKKKEKPPKRRRKQYYETFTDEKLPERRRTPLHHACIGHQLESIKFFVRNGANVNIQDHDGDTPLLAVLKEAVRIHQDYAKMHAILTVLVEAGTDMSLCGRFTPIFSACTIGHNSLILYMLQCGSISTKMVKNFIKDTPLTTLIKQNNLIGTKLVVQAGYRFKRDSLFRDRIDLDTEIGRYLEEQLGTVKPLTRQCRTVIRQKLGTINVRNKLMTLPLPSMMLNYVDLNDLRDLIPEVDTSGRDGDFVTISEIGTDDSDV